MRERLLKQLPTFRPFVGHLCTLLAVAWTARKNQVVGIVTSPSRQRNNVIDLVLVLYACVAPMAFAFLSDALALNILACVIAFGLGFTSAATLVSGSICLPMRLKISAPLRAPLLFMCFVVLAIIFANMLYIPSAPITVLLANTIAASGTLLALFIQYLFFILTSKSFSALGLALPALVVKTISHTSIFVKCRERLWLLASRTLFDRGVHSVSLSLYLMMLSAGGEIIRFSGSYSLADIPILPQNGAVR